MLTTPMRRTLTASLAVATLLALSACGNDDAPAPSATQTAANGDVFNDADVAFATEMIPHHAQALAMVDLTIERDLDPEVTQLAEDIRDAQAPEIEKLTDWLTDWDEPIPETSRDHANAHGDGELDSDMPGMMSADEMEGLEAAPDSEFQDLWLEMMVEHHRGAIEMAEAEQGDGAFDPAVKLADAIASGQEDEVEVMEGLLAG